MTFDEHIALALRLLDRDHDPEMAIYVLRDLPETKAADLSDLAWSLYQGGTVASEVRWFIGELRKAAAL